MFFFSFSFYFSLNLFSKSHSFDNFTFNHYSFFLFSFLLFLRQLLRLNSFYKVLQTLSLLSGIKEKEEIFVCLPQMDVSMFMCVCFCVYSNILIMYTHGRYHLVQKLHSIEEFLELDN